MSVANLRMALDVTLVSYTGQFDIGITAQRDVVPDRQRIAELFREAFAKLTQKRRIRVPRNAAARP